MALRKIVLLGILLLAGGWTSLQAQLTNFPKDKEAYLSKLRGYLEDENKKDIEDETLDSLFIAFEPVWMDPKLEEEEVGLVVEISNNMVRKRITAYPSWRYLLELVQQLQLREEKGSLQPFLENLKPLTQESARQIRRYLENIHGAFYEQRLFSDGRLTWEVLEGQGSYGYAEEPYFQYEEAELWGFQRGDSTLIGAADFRYYPRSYRIEGSSGKAFFTRAGYSRDSAYVEFDQFSLDLQKGDYEVDSARLHFLQYLDEPVWGNFSEKLTTQRQAGEAVFPRFRSMPNRVKIDKLPGEVEFLGGISVIGSKFYGSGNDSSKAELLYYYQDTLLVRGRAERFRIEPDMLYSTAVETSIYLDEDSIYHPKLTMRFLPKKEQFMLIREDEGMGMAPFSNSFHNVQMKFQSINWTIGSPLMELSNLNMGGAEAPAVFESQNYYRDRRWREIEGMGRSPILILRELSRQNNDRRKFTTQELARHIHSDESSAHRFLMNMAIYGFVDYRTGQREAVLKDKIFDYFYNARGIRDYDVIQFVSRVEKGANAALSLENNDLDVNGIERIALSDSQKVGLFPAGKKITLQEDLDFNFDGRIKAGRFNYWGEQFKFSYDDFMMNMTEIDSMRFKVLSFESNSLGQRELVDVKTVLQDLTGELLIDKPNNKSGKENYSHYPIFRCGTNSYIYYDKPSTFGGVYDREEFFVELEPFEIDSLDNISTRGLTFDGTFTSAGIFPDMDQTIKVQRDYSLGFQTETPPEGLSAYGGKGTFNQTITLSNVGLRGNGSIDYLQSTAVGDTFFFFPDSTNGLAHQYHIDEKTGGAGSNPPVEGQEVEVHWEPYNDVFYTRSTESPFAMYGDLGMRGTGQLAYGPDGLGGRGLMEFLNAETRSQDYEFQHRKVLSPKLAFRVRARPSVDWGFGLENATAEIDFDAQRGYFTLNDSAEYLEFTANQYISAMDHAEWLIPEKAIETQMQGGRELAPMISTRSDQDSLRFQAQRSKFYLERNLLEAFEVPEIRVADASIYPDTGYVAIDSAAAMRTLTNAALTASVKNQYHQLYGGTLDISSRHEFTGNADYEYVDKDGTPWPIHFKDVHADTGTTVGFGQVSKEDGLYLSPNFAYHGNVRLNAKERFLYFNGATHIESDCPALSTNWFKFKSRIDPRNIQIELPEVEADDKTKTLANGIYLASDTVSGFAAFLSQEVSPNDRQMFFANGLLFYDEAQNSYIIAPREKIENEKAPLNKLRFDNNQCLMYGEGEMSLGESNSQMEIHSFGTVEYDLSRDEMKLDLVAGLRFPFSDDLQERMSTLFLDYGGSEGIDLTRPAFRTFVRHHLDPEDQEDFYAAVNTYGAPEELPKSMRYTFLLGRLSLFWSPESVSFRTEEKVGVASLDKYFVNVLSPGSFELKRSRRGDELYALLDIDRSTYIYLEYRRNILGIYSSDEELMNQLKEMKLKNRRHTEKGMSPFTFMISTRGKMNRFIRRMGQF